jgi:thioredoxin 1/putative thioredoxin
MIEPFLPRPAGALKAMELAELIKKGVVAAVDTRDAGAFSRAHIPGATNMPLDELESRIAELYMLPGQPVLYCRAGDKTKDFVAKMAEGNVELGYLEGGMLAWESDGFPIER